MNEIKVVSKGKEKRGLPLGSIGMKGEHLCMKAQIGPKEYRLIALCDGNRLHDHDDTSELLPFPIGTKLEITVVGEEEEG